MTRYKNYSDVLDLAVTRLNEARAIRTSEQDHLDEAVEKLTAEEEAQQIVQTICSTIQQHAHKQVCDLVTSCLQFVFDDPYTFDIRFERKRGKTEAVLLFKRNGEEIDPMSAAGGGVIDVASFGLRLAAILLGKPKRRPVLVLDEPFKFVSRDYLPRVRELLEALAKEKDFQLIMVTHIPELRVGTILDLDA